MTTQTTPQRVRTSDVISQEVRAWAARFGMRQRHLAEILGVSQTQVSQRLSGRIAWSVDEVDALAAAFGIDPLDLQRRPAGIISPREIGQDPALSRDDVVSSSRRTPPWPQPIAA